MSLRAIPSLLQETVLEWYADRVPRLGAALAFYTLFSLAPLLVVVTAIAALGFGREIASTQLIQQIELFIGPEGARVIQATIENTSRPRSGIIATLIGLATMLFGTTIVFSELQDGLHTILKVSPRSRRSMAFRLMWERLLAFCMVLGMSVLLLLSILAHALLNAILPMLGTWLPSQWNWWQTLSLGLSSVIVTLLLIMIYKVLPDVEIGWEEVLIGAVVTAALFMLGKYLIELYLRYSTTAVVYGAAGSLVVLLMWIYYSAQIVYFGAEFTKVYAKYRGHRVVPSANATPMTQEDLIMK
jgi:membrane protein